MHVRQTLAADHARLTVVGDDRPGMLGVTSGVVASFGLSVCGAVAATWSGSGLAFQALTVEDTDRRALSQQWWDEVAQCVRDELSGGMHAAVTWKPRGAVAVRTERLDLDHSLLTVEAADRVGLLWAISSHLRNCGINVRAAAVSHTAGRAADTFLVDGYPEPDELRSHLLHGHCHHSAVPAGRMRRGGGDR